MIESELYSSWLSRIGKCLYKDTGFFLLTFSILKFILKNRFCISRIPLHDSICQCMSHICKGRPSSFLCSLWISLSCYQLLIRSSSSVFGSWFYPISNWKKKKIVVAFNLIQKEWVVAKWKSSSRKSPKNDMYFKHFNLT